MHVHYDWDHELNLGRDGLGLNNIESMFDWFVVLFPWKLILKYKNMVKWTKIFFFVKNYS